MPFKIDMNPGYFLLRAVEMREQQAGISFEK